MLLSLIFACTPIKFADETGGNADTSEGTDSGLGDSADSNLDTNVDTSTEGLNGEWPASAVPAPEFEAKNMDGSTRSKPDLVGHPTVVWFYPLAGSGG
mgnify:CR=1 FL=1